MKIVPKKIISLVLSLAVALSFVNLPAFMQTSSAFSTGDDTMVVCNYFPYSYDFRGSGLGAEFYGQIPNLSIDDKIAYCIDSSADSGGGGNASTFEVDSVEGNGTLYSLALSYGYTGTTKYGYSDDVEQLATQILIWNISHSDRGWWNNSSGVTGLESSVLDRYTSGMWDIGSDVKTVYGKIKEKVVGYSSLTPSFSSSTIEREMTYNKTTSKWTLSLTDSNGVLRDFDWAEAVKGYSYLSVSISSNTITFTSTKDFTTKTLTADYTDSKYSPKNAVLLKPISGLNKQKCVTIETATCKSATVKLFAEESEGDLKIKKTSEDGIVSGISFTVKKGSRVIGTYTTTSSGEILIPDLEAGTYTVSETVKSGYVAQDPQTVEVVSGETATVTFNNILARGDLTVKKTFNWTRGNTTTNVTSSIYQAVVNDIKFNIKGTSTAGQEVNITKGLTKSGNDYVAKFENIPVGTYTLSEKLGTTASKYVVAVADQSVTVTYNATANKTIANGTVTGGLKFKKEVEYGNVNTIQFNLKGTSFSGIPIDITVDVGEKSTSQVIPWMGTINGVQIKDTAKVTVTNGTVTFTNIPVGTYTLTENRVNDCYIPMVTKNNVTIVANKVIDFNGTVNGTGTIINNEKRGGLRITKHSENGEVEGVHFRLQGTAQSGQNVLLDGYTDKNGVLEFQSVPIGSNYMLTEVNAPVYFIPNPPLTGVVIEWDKVNNVSIPNSKDIYNWDKRGDLFITKTIEASKYPENNSIAGFEFWLHGTSDSGETVSLKTKTDSKGNASFKDVLIGTYTLEEINTPVRYYIPEPKAVTVHWNGKDHEGKVVNVAQSNIPAATASFRNELKYFSVEIVKVDSEKIIPQGEATLEGAVYGIYDNGVLIDRYTTDKDGRFTTKEYECGTKWTVKEITPSKGYLLDETVYKVGSDPKLYTKKNNTAPIITSTEDVNKGSFLVLKTTGNGTGVFEFEEGAEFEVFLTNSGSYAAANEYERDYLVIGADGTATTKLLPFGTYTVHQTKAWDGRAFADDYNVFVGKVNNDFQMIPINNGSFESRIKVVKVDGDAAEGEEPKAIPIAGAAFQIYDPNGDLVVQKITYPSYMEFDTFYTNENGDFTTPEPLPYGEGYSLVEVSAPFGYVLSTEPIYFNVTAVDADLENGLATIVVPFPDTPQKGSIKVDKLGEVFSSVVNNDGYYQAQYAVEHLKGATYAIYAVDDIYTPDGTLRYSKDEEVDRVTTGDDGAATSKPLYLGSYTVVEVQTPEGMTLDSKPMSVTLTYADQTVELLDNFEVSQFNDRQKLAISVIKTLEMNDKFGIGTNNEILAVSFGLYAGEELLASDGSVIPQGGLIEVKYCDNKGKITFESDLPFGKYYVQEISTDDHYVLNGEKFEVSFEYQGQDVTVVELSVNDGEPIVNELIYGLVGGVKVDEETGIGLSGAVIGLFTESTTLFSKDTALMLATTDEKGEFEFNDVPYGTYLVKELEAPEGYTLNDNTFTVKVETDNSKEYVTIEDKLVYGNIELVKTDADNDDIHLSGAKFGVWADVNGNGVLDDGDTYIGLMIDNNGTYSYSDLIHGFYLVKEIEAPNEYLLDEGVYSVAVAENGVTYTVSNNEKGTFDNKHTPRIGTTATVNGGKVTKPTGTITIDDEVSYTNLHTDREYTVVGTLMDKSTGEPWKINGKELTSTVTFTPENHNGSVVVTFAFDSMYLTETVDLVVFETLYEGDHEWAVHADINDKGQTVRIYKPELGTTANVNGEKEVNATGTVTIKDVVEYKSLVIGEKYRVSGILMDKATGEALLINGSIIQNEVEFVAEEKNGHVEVEFTFDVGSLSEVIEVVVFENLYLGDMQLAAHADIEDKDQTVRIKKPKIKTTATSNGDHEEFMKGTVTIQDDIAYHNLVVNKKYTVYGVLMDKSTGKELLINGEKVTAETTFVAENENGVVSVFFEFDASALTKQTSVVAYERLEYNNVEIAVHTDIEDEDQTITFVEPSIGTKLAFNEDEMEERQQMVLDDVVYFHNLVAGREYKLYGTLRDENGDIYLDCDGKEARGEITFVPETSDGEVTVRFLLNASTLDDELDWFVVAFEELYYNDIKIASHEDMTAKDQTVELFPFPDGDVPRGDFPNTGIHIRYGGIILAAITVGTGIVVNRRRKRR